MYIKSILKDMIFIHEMLFILPIFSKKENISPLLSFLLATTAKELMLLNYGAGEDS